MGREDFPLYRFYDSVDHDPDQLSSGIPDAPRLAGWIGDSLGGGAGGTRRPDASGPRTSGSRRGRLNRAPPQAESPLAQAICHGGQPGRRAT